MSHLTIPRLLVALTALVTASPLDIPVVAYIAPPETIALSTVPLFEGTVTATAFSRNTAADSIFVNGSLRGTVANPDSTTTEIAPAVLDHLYVTIKPWSSACNHIDFLFQDFHVAEYQDPLIYFRTKLGSAPILADSAVRNDLCTIGFEVREPTKNSIRKIDRALSDLNARLGG